MRLAAAYETGALVALKGAGTLVAGPGGEVAVNPTGDAKAGYVAVSGTGNLIQSGEALPVVAAPAGGGPKTKASAMTSSTPALPI